MWTPKLVTFKEEARAAVGIYIIIYVFKKQCIYKIIIRRKRQHSKLAAVLLEDGSPNGHQLT